MSANGCTIRAVSALLDRTRTRNLHCHALLARPEATRRLMPQPLARFVQWEATRARLVVPPAVFAVLGRYQRPWATRFAHRALQEPINLAPAARAV